MNNRTKNSVINLNKCREVDAKQASKIKNNFIHKMKNINGNLTN